MFSDQLNCSSLLCYQAPWYKKETGKLQGLLSLLGEGRCFFFPSLCPELTERINSGEHLYHIFNWSSSCIEPDVLPRSFGFSALKQNNLCCDHGSCEQFVWSPTDTCKARCRLFRSSSPSASQEMSILPSHALAQPSRQLVLPWVSLFPTRSRYNWALSVFPFPIPLWVMLQIEQWLNHWKEAWDGGGAPMARAACPTTAAGSSGCCRASPAPHLPVTPLFLPWHYWAGLRKDLFSMWLPLILPPQTSAWGTRPYQAINL